MAVLDAVRAFPSAPQPVQVRARETNLDVVLGKAVVGMLREVGRPPRLRVEASQVARRDPYGGLGRAGGERRVRVGVARARPPFVVPCGVGERPVGVGRPRAHLRLAHDAVGAVHERARARLPVQDREDDRRGGGQEQEQHAAASHTWQRDLDDHVVRGLLFPPDARGFESELERHWSRGGFLLGIGKKGRP